MRALALFSLPLAALFASAALAQPCDPTDTDEVCADTTDWHRYFPLAVGNQWQYRFQPPGEPETLWSWTITGETEAGGDAYSELERCDATAEGAADCDEPVLLRYDDEHELILRRTGSGEAWWEGLPCNLGAAFNTGEYVDESVACTGPAEGIAPKLVEGAYGAAIAVPPDDVAGDTRKRFELYPGTGPELYAGLGATKFYYDLQENPARLAYAFVNGRQVGAPAFASCDPADADPFVACPDTTDWRGYFPLAVGNEWQYRETIDVGEEAYWGRRITGAVEIEGRTYFELERCDEDAEGTVVCGERVPVRYSDEHPTLVRYTEEGEVPWGMCLLDIPFGGMPQTESGFYECEGLGQEGPLYTGAWGAYDATLQIPPDVVSGNTSKAIGIAPMDIVRLYAGIGPVSFEDEYHPEATRLVHVRVDGVEYGTPAFVFPSSGEAAPAPTARTAFTEAYPNPARGAMRAQFVLDAPQAVTLDLVDVLGRRVRAVDLGPQPVGAHDVRLDLGGLRAGVYVLRLRGAAGAEATRRVVVVR